MIRTCSGCGFEFEDQKDNVAMVWCCVDCYNAHPETHLPNDRLRYEKGPDYPGHIKSFKCPHPNGGLGIFRFRTSQTFINESGLEFTDVSSEQYRTYTFPSKESVTIKYPTHLHVSSSGGHRVFDADGNSHYIPSGWIHLQWRAREGKANFVK